MVTMDEDGRKEYKLPKIKIAKVNRVNIIATSDKGGAGGTIPDAPFSSRQSVWDDDDED